jgi:hypothetical protein
VNWTTRVAWHEVQTEWRRQARSTSGQIPELLGGPDPARVIEARYTLGAAKKGMGSLPLDDRLAILTALDDSNILTTRMSAREKMRRYRARQRLAALMDSEPGDR